MGEGDPDRGAEGSGRFEPEGLTGLAAPPGWLRELGLSAWLTVGVTLFLVGAVWLLALTRTITTPVITATVIAAVASPLVGRLERRGVSRGLGTALLLLALIVLGALLVIVLIGAVSGQVDALDSLLSSAKETVAQWLSEVGVDRESAARATDDASAGLGSAVPALLGGVLVGIKQLSSLVVFLGLTALSLFFLLKDGRLIRAWAEGHLRVPRPVAHRIGDRVLESLRGYFLGVSLVAAFNAVVVGIGALLLGVPLAGTVAVVTFVGAYIPYLGAWGAGIFAVVIALGGAGTEAAAGMVIVQLLANGILQQMVQPIAYGAALGIHPLAVLIVTIAGGALFGAVGLILAAPLTAAATRIAADLSKHSGSDGDVPVPGTRAP